MITKVIVLQFVLSLFCICSSIVGVNCSSNPDSKPQIAEEKAKPLEWYYGDSGYQHDHIGFNRIPLKGKMDVLWSKEDSSLGDNGEIIADQYGNLWYLERSAPPPQNIIDNSPDPVKLISKNLVKLDRNGSILQKYKRAKGYLSFNPVCVTESGFIEVNYRPDRPADKLVSLIFTNLKGELVWETKPVKSNFDQPITWRFDADKIALPIDVNTGETKFYDISNGNLLEMSRLSNFLNNLVITDKSPYYNPVKVVRYKDNYLIAISKDSIMMLDDNMNILWSFGRQSRENIPSILLNDNVILFCNNNELNAIAADTGKLLWGNNDYNSYHLYGISPNKSFIVTASPQTKFDELDRIVPGTDSDWLVLFDKDGKKVYSYDMGEYFTGKLISYKDDSVLIGHKKGLTHVENTGNVSWSLSNSELGFEEDSKLMCSILTPTVDCGIVAYFVWLDISNGLKDTSILMSIGVK
jgi:hypothetical protein